MATDLICVAKKSGADCAKFQIWKTDRFVAKSSPQYESFKSMEFDKNSWRKIKATCDEIKIDFMASAWDEYSVDFLDSLGVKAFKIGSGDLTYEPMVRAVAEKGKPVFLSTGMADSQEILRALMWLRYGKTGITLMKCTVDYPCSEDDVNLRGMQSLGFKHCSKGFSDHTKGHIAACMAVAMGATCVEKHFTIKETEDAIGAEQFKDWVEKVRQAERIMGSAELKTFACEEKWKPIARRGESELRE